MELRDFIEQDIVDFLDRRFSQDYLAEQSAQGSTARLHEEDSAAFLVRDYEKELFAALQEHNLPKAKKVLHDVKDSFESYPVGSPERKQLKALLHSLYNKFKSYLEDQTTFDKLEHAIDDIERPGWAQQSLTSSEVPSIFRNEPSPEKRSDSDRQPSPQPTTAPSPPKPAVSQETDSKTKEAEAAALKDFLNAMQAIEKAIDREDFEEAQGHYVRAKEAYRKLPARHQRMHRDKMLAHHKKLVDIMHSRRQKEVVTQDLKSRDALQKFLSHLHALDVSLMNNDVAAGHKYYHEAKACYAKLSENDKRAHRDAMLRHHKRLEKLTAKKEEAYNQDHQNNSLERLERAIANDIAHRKVHKAMLHYEQLRDEIHRLESDERPVWVKRLRHCYDDIVNASKSGVKDEDVAVIPHSGSLLLESHEKKLSKNRP